jgi:hypothetical protein
VTDDAWDKLAAPFPAAALRWRVMALSEDKAQARLRPLLEHKAVVCRLDEVLKRAGWSSQLAPLGASAVICTLSALGVSKSVALAFGPNDAERTARDAFVLCAEQFGLLPPVERDAEYWVECDSENGEPLYEPAIPDPVLAARDEAAPVSYDKTPGQQAIDRLLERLKAEGQGLEAAKLVVAYGGYGSSPEKARELYGKLRTLLLNQEAVSGA